MRKLIIGRIFLVGLFALLAANPLHATLGINRLCSDSWDSWVGQHKAASSANSRGSAAPNSSSSGSPSPILAPLSRADILKEALEAKFPNSTVTHAGTGGRGIIMRVTDPTGASVIFKFALDPKDLRMVATLKRDPKIISKAKAADPEGSQQLVEIHGNTEVKTDTDETALLMGDATEGSLESHLADFGPGRNPLEVLDAWKQIALGLRSLHRARITHRDIKPENILIANNPDGTKKYMVGDYDLVYERGDYLPPDKVAGTPAYMSNEAMRGDPPVPVHDLHSLNILFMEMLMGHSLYELDYNDRANHVVPLKVFPGLAPIPLLHQLPDKTAAAVDPHLRKIVKREYKTIDELIVAIDEATAEIKQAEAKALAEAQAPPKRSLFGWVSKLKQWWWKNAADPKPLSQESEPVW